MTTNERTGTDGPGTHQRQRGGAGSRAGRAVCAVLAALLTALTVLTAAAANATAAPSSAPGAEDGAGAADGAADGARDEDVGALLDRLVPRQLAHHRVPGAAVVLVRDGRTLLSRGYGTADRAHHTPVDPSRTGFFMASDAKVFTAVAVLQQVARGRLDLDADVNRYLTDFKIKNTYPGHPVTVRDLLTHTGGFDNAILGRSTATARGAGPLGADLAAHQPRRVRPPGTVSSYDNYGVALAGHLVETVARTPFAAYVKRHVLDPLGMRHTTFAQPHPAGLDTTLAVGYRPDGKGQRAQDGQYGPWSPTGAGAVTTAADMGRLMNALLDGGGPVLDAAGSAALLRRQFGNDPRLPGIGLVLEERRRDGHRMLVKDGDLPGFHGNMALLPDRRTGVYVVYNGDGEDGGAAWAGQQLVNEVADRLAPPPAAAPKDTAHRPTGGYTGHYASSRTSETELTRAASLTGVVTVAAGPGGGLTTTGLSRDPDVTEQRWDPVGPGLFAEHGGQDRLALRERGGAMRLALASDPTVLYTLQPWYRSPVLHQWVLLGSLAVLLVAVVALPVCALVRRGRPVSGLARAAGLLSWGSGALLVAATLCFALLASDANALNRTIMVDDSALLHAVPVLMALALGTTAGAAVCTVPVWRRRLWGVPGRLLHTGGVLAAVAFLAVAWQYRLVG
ncbi:serine hydrolase domain-containing protein [Streptomyces sp. NPDC050560]|uniref:serine hydrolase domain-containing protein n=1 Tax=Streptomyces sp. NPDC050560 TaxID=3365630 RepID=UPI0037B50FC8